MTRTSHKNFHDINIHSLNENPKCFLQRKTKEDLENFFLKNNPKNT